MAKKARLDKAKVKQLYSRTHSVAKVAETLKASYMGVRRNLLGQGIKLVNARQITDAVAKPKMGGKQIEVIARAVAQAILGKATVQVQPQTREAMWSNIHKGVESGMKQIGFRP